MKTYLDIYLDIRYSETNQEVHENDADEDDEEEDHEVAGEGEDCLPVLVDEVLVLDLPGHHDKGLDQRRHGLHVETLVVGEQDAETGSMHCGQATPFLVNVSFNIDKIVLH